MKKIFFDTNVLLDVVLHREDDYPTKQIITLSYLRRDDRIYTSYLSLANMAYILRRNSIEDIKDNIRSVMKWCNVLSNNDMQMIDALSNASSDFEDSLQIMCAEAKGCDVIITRNPDHFRSFTDIPVLTPQEYMSHCSE